MILTVLGSGAALPTGHRCCSAQVLNVNGFKMLIDCAEGTQNGIRRMRFRLQSISTILISHLHGDHFFGLPGLLSTMHLCGRTEPATVVAPVGAREVIETTFRLTGNNISYPIEWHEMDFTEGLHRVFENAKCTVDAFPLTHSVPTYGFLVGDRPEGSRGRLRYAYCCDTVYTEAILPYVEGVDLLCLESTFTDEYAPLAEKRLHLTAGQAARLAAQAGARQLLLTHISARYKEPDLLLSQAQAHFPNTTVAADGLRLDLRASARHE
ncbi:MAG: ribonuclease Z [Bacteroidales bacterium]|nr:ribonuclease Z [Bacteroidales bacterium]